jgi:hypothetical protein
MRLTEDPAGLPYKLSSGLFIKESILDIDRIV